MKPQSHDSGWINKRGDTVDYEAAFNDIITVMEADKNLKLPYKNYAIADAWRLLAVIRMAIDVPAALPPDAPVFPRPHPLGCICADDMPPRKDCPVHGTL